MKFPKNILLLLFFFVFITGILIAPHIGTAWDEPDNIHSAGVYYNFLLHGFDQSFLTSRESTASYWDGKIFTQEPSLARYPPVPNYVGMIVALAGEKIGIIHHPRGVLEAFHVASGAFFGVLVASMFAWGILIGLSLHTSILVAAVTFLTPTLFGYGFSNIKDIAQTALFSVSLYALVYGSIRTNPKWHVFGGILWGLALASKFNAVYVPLIWGAWMVGMLIRKSHGAKLRVRFMRFISGSIPLIMSGITILGIGIITTFCFWPYLWVDPAGKLAQVAAYFTSVGRGYRIYWDGIYYIVGAGESLWWYPVANFFLVTPLPILVAGLVGMIVGMLSVVGFLSRRRLIPSPVSPRMGSLMLIWITLPLLRIVLPTAAFYDGIRHFLEILPAFILLAGIGAEFVGRWLMVVLSRNLRIRPHAVLAGISLLCILYLAFINGTYFPYSTGYYNALAIRPDTRFDRDITGLAIKEGLDYLHAQYGNVSLWAPISGHQSWYYLREYDNYVYTQADADSIILINKRSHVRREDLEEMIPQYTLVYTISRGDAVFGWVYRRRKS